MKQIKFNAGNTVVVVENEWGVMPIGTKVEVVGIVSNDNWFGVMDEEASNYKQELDFSGEAKETEDNWRFIIKDTDGELDDIYPSSVVSEEVWDRALAVMERLHVGDPVVITEDSPFEATNSIPKQGSPTFSQGIIEDIRKDSSSAVLHLVRIRWANGYVVETDSPHVTGYLDNPLLLREPLKDLVLTEDYVIPAGTRLVRENEDGYAGLADNKLFVDVSLLKAEEVE